jgi:molybdate transport system substrate-binding protein
MRWAAIALAVAAVVAGCGGDDDQTSGQPPKQALVVSAAASLKDAFTSYGDSFSGADIKLSFAGSDELAAQIRQGVKPDLFAAANTKLPDALYADGLVEKPAVFAGNELVIAVPASGKIDSLDDLAASGVKLAIGAEGVPVGDYTRKVLDGLPAEQRKAILGNVRSNEPDVKGVVGKLTQGAVDAGFVYRSDVRAADDELKAIALPAELKPKVAYGVAVVKGAKHPEQARAFVQGLLNGAGAKALEAAGFLPPPTS